VKDGEKVYKAFRNGKAVEAGGRQGYALALADSEGKKRKRLSGEEEGKINLPSVKASEGLQERKSHKTGNVSAVRSSSPNKNTVPRVIKKTLTSSTTKEEKSAAKAKGLDSWLQVQSK
jgi:hypothetical protein